MDKEKRRVLKSVIFPLSFLILIWIVKLIEHFYQLDFGTFGIFPLKIEGLKGILFSPLIHGDFKHIGANSFPLFFLLWGVFYFYKEVAYKVFFFSYFVTGIWVWLFARDAFHIGASGLVYAFGSFLFFSGLIRRNTQMMALSMLIVFLYGGMIWGVFPLKDQVSWESHLMGGVAGLILAIFYKNIGPQRKQYIWDIEPENEDELLDEFIEEDFEDGSVVK
ncbi:MAG: rhomboid family intramembrane serine protease [Bacteroidetes bacterium]|nr:rhomboid family intramembrane serine protease [Bacteroidota bacterium]